MLICPSDLFSITNVMLLGASFHFETLFSTQSINLVAEEISRNKPIVQTPITYFINQKEKHVFRHNSILTLMKSDASFFRIDIIYMIYLGVKYLSVVCLNICYEKLGIKTKLTTVGHFLAKKLVFCPSDII